MQNPEPEQHDNEIETNNDYHASPELSAHPYVMKNLTGIGKRLNRLDFAILIFTVYLFELLAHKLFGIN
ncbi:MAG: hypothetical protein KJO88_09060, partial [Gammaproteobacteria bacterium]|nr:hypothetical protein [Gammaproteobacteria bacterium]